MTTSDKAPRKKIPKAIQDDIDSKKMRVLVGALGAQAAALNRARSYAKFTSRLAHTTMAVFDKYGAGGARRTFPKVVIIESGPFAYRSLLLAAIDCAEVLGFTPEPWLNPAKYNNSSFEFTYAFAGPDNHRVDVVITNTESAPTGRAAISNQVIEFSIFDFHKLLPYNLVGAIELANHLRPRSVRMKIKV